MCEKERATGAVHKSILSGCVTAMLKFVSVLNIQSARAPLHTSGASVI